MDSPSARMTESQDDPNAGEALLLASMIDLAAPDLYASNAFRRLQLSVEATGREISKRRERLERALRADVAITAGDVPILSLTEELAPEDPQAIAHDLLDGERRLAHEFFWFWPLVPGEGAGDPALRHMIESDHGAALALWRNGASTGRHNLAVYHHLMALQAEEQGVGAAMHWREAMHYWCDVLEDDAFWDRVRDRVDALGDASLSEDSPERLRATLPVALSIIDATLALDAFDEGRAEAALVHAKRARLPGFDDFGSADRARRLVVEPLRNWIRLKCEEAGRETDASGSTGQTVLARLREQTRHELRKIDLLFEADHLVRQAAHDQVAGELRDCVVAHGNATQDWSRAIAQIDEILEMTAGQALRLGLAKDRDDIEDIIMARTCWFCGRGSPDAGAKLPVTMHGDVVWVGSEATWTYDNFDVPRCAPCKAEETAPEEAKKTTRFITAVVLVPTMLILFMNTNIGILLLSFGAAFFAAYLAGEMAVGFKAESIRQARSAAGRLPAPRDAMTYPKITRLTARGWSPGEKPPGVT